MNITVLENYEEMEEIIKLKKEEHLEMIHFAFPRDFQ